MGKSFRKTDICGNTKARSEQFEKRITNRRLRKLTKQKFKTDPDAVLPEKKDVSDTWLWPKDGKADFGDLKTGDPDMYRRIKGK
jgi:hypothetical protein